MCLARLSTRIYKGYKLLNLSTNDIFISRNVVYYETEFPFSSTPSSIFPLSVSDIPLHTSTSTPVQSTSSSPPLSAVNPPKTTSGRTIKSPTYLQEYVCGSTASTPYPIHHILSSSHLSPSYSAFYSNIVAIP